MKKNHIWITYGLDYKQMAKNICEAAGLADLIGNKKKSIGLKPNLVNTSPASNGATTHPEVVSGIIEYLKENGFNDISIIEGSWVGDKTESAFRACGYIKLKEHYGIKLVDTQKDRYHEYDCKGVKINICDSALAVDFMINIPVMKGHCQTTVTCALKNNKGIIPNAEKRRFHTMGLHKPIAHLNAAARNDFIVVDGICGDLDFEEGGNPVQQNRILGFTDPVLCDAYICHLLGYKIEEVPYITIAEAIGVGSSAIDSAEIHELNDGSGTITKLQFTRKTIRLAQKVEAKDACSACYGSLIHALDRLEKSGHVLSEPVCIGQGYRGCKGKLGIGSCTVGFEHSLKGCPPTALDILSFLKDV